MTAKLPKPPPGQSSYPVAGSVFTLNGDHAEANLTSTRLKAHSRRGIIRALCGVDGVTYYRLDRESSDALHYKAVWLERGTEPLSNTQTLFKR